MNKKNKIHPFLSNLQACYAVLNKLYVEVLKNSQPNQKRQSKQFYLIRFWKIDKAKNFSVQPYISNLLKN